MQHWKDSSRRGESKKKAIPRPESVLSRATNVIANTNRLRWQAKLIAMEITNANILKTSNKKLIQANKTINDGSKRGKIKINPRFCAPSRSEIQVMRQTLRGTNQAQEWQFINHESWVVERQKTKNRKIIEYWNRTKIYDKGTNQIWANIRFAYTKPNKPMISMNLEWGS